ncbi:MAG: hypothetical protein PHW61_07055 [Eubacteriales bacterium]|nr:hypothetical protein [Eubacteriales bacterium]
MNLVDESVGNIFNNRKELQMLFVQDEVCFARLSCVPVYYRTDLMKAEFSCFRSEHGVSVPDRNFIQMSVIDRLHFEKESLVSGRKLFERHHYLRIVDFGYGDNLRLMQEEINEGPLKGR